MPAGLKIQSQIIATISLIAVMLLSGCSRDNPLSIPKKYIEEPTAYCIENGPYSEFTLIESIDITNITTAIPESYPDTYDGVLLKTEIPYLIDKSRITPIKISDYDYIKDPFTGDFESTLIALEKTIDDAVLADTTLSSVALTDIILYEPIVKNILITVEYQSNNETDSETIDDEKPFITTDLTYGKNYVSTKVNATILVPRTIIDCDNPLTQEEIEDEDFGDADKYKAINVSQVFEIELDRKDFDFFIGKNLPSFNSLSESDQIGRVLAINNDFLVVGSPNEDSLAQGIVTAENLSQNDDAVNSGAVYIFKKSDVNTWNLHSFVKSSNSETGDLFGTDVAIDGNTLLISAPGEDSFAEGVHLSTESQITNLKLNNTASSSGAVYVFEFDPVAGSWSETHYIKPQKNAISDGKYDKGFGAQIALYGNKMLIAAPLEDSDNGDASNSMLPDSGAVYSYAYSSTDHKWSFSSVLKAFNPSQNDKFGSAIAMDDKFIAVGSPFEDNESTKIINGIYDLEAGSLEMLNSNASVDSGAVYIFNYSQTNNLFTLNTFLKSTNSDQFDYFGSSLSISDSKLLVGAIGEDSSGTGLNRDMKKNDLKNSGAAYLFKYNQASDQWAESAFIKANDSQVDASFGKYVALDGNNIFVSSPLYDSDYYVNTGKAYYYVIDGNELTQNLDYHNVGISNEMYFGSELAIFGSNLAIGGSRFMDGQVVSAGSVFTYE